MEVEEKGDVYKPQHTAEYGSWAVISSHEADEDESESEWSLGSDADGIERDGEEGWRVLEEVCRGDDSPFTFAAIAGQMPTPFQLLLKPRRNVADGSVTTSVNVLLQKLRKRAGAEPGQIRTACVGWPKARNVRSTSDLVFVAGSESDFENWKREISTRAA